MAYLLTAAEPVGLGVKRIVREQVDKAEARLGAEGGATPEGLYSARRRLKKARAALRLVRPAIDGRVYRTQDRCLRDAGRRLAGVRDHQALVEALDGLVKQRALAPEAFDAVHGELIAQRSQVLQSFSRDDAALPAVRAHLAAARRHLASWDIDRDDWGMLSEALKQTYSDGHAALGPALRDGEAERMHEWRKVVKYLWYQVRLLRMASPGLLEPIAEQSHQLALVLGRDHDLWLLSAWLAKWGRGRVDPQADADLPALTVMVARRRAQLHDAAQPLARQVYGLKPGSFVDRVGGAFHAWRGQSERPQAAESTLRSSRR